MILLRAISLGILAAWTGGLAALGLVAAPAIFATLEARDPAGGRTLAGEVFGVVFQRFQYVALAFGALLVAVLVVRALLGPRPLRFAWRLWAVVAMTAATAATVFVLAPRIDRIRRDTPGAVAALPDGDPRKAEFGRLHGLSNVLMIATLGAGVGLIWMEARDADAGRA
jgi:hypothetical protein